MRPVKNNRAAASPEVAAPHNMTHNTVSEDSTPILRAAAWLLIVCTLIVLVWLVLAVPDAGLLVRGDW